MDIDRWQIPGVTALVGSPLARNFPAFDKIIGVLKRCAIGSFAFAGNMTESTWPNQF
jgi:hypothetical protein